jgi:hypothetical protein
VRSFIQEFLISQYLLVLTITSRTGSRPNLETTTSDWKTVTAAIRFDAAPFIA